MRLILVFVYLLVYLDINVAAKRPAKRDFYKILGLKRADVKNNPKIVKRAYHRLAQKWHPDKNPDNEEKATAKFRDIADAYTVLSDEKKRADYDQFGEEVPGEGGGGGGGGSEDAFKMYEQFFNFGGQGGRGGKFSFNFGGGGDPFGGGGDPFGGRGQGGGKPEKRIFAKTDVAEWTSTEFQNNIESPNSGEFITIVFYRAAHAGDLKQEYVAAHKTFQGVVELAAVNCGKNAELCEKEKIKSESPTIILYFWKAGKLSRKRLSSQTLTAKSIGNWLRDGLPNYSHNIRSETDLRNLASEEAKSLIVLFTDKKHAPAIIKVLAGKFQKSVNVGIVKLPNKDDAKMHPVAKLFAVEKVPSLLAVTDRESLEAQFFTGQMTMSYLSLFFSQKRKSAPKTRKLTSALYQNGHCAQSVSHFCLVKVGSPNERELSDLNELARKLKSEHVEVYWTTQEEFPTLASIFSEHELVLWRPKRRKWKAFEGTFTVGAVADFVENAVNGGAPLPQILHTEL